ncbi:MAG: hypothetical protein Q8O33_04500 [Pseudomonadota bacterium]|nr:hypothetical protein [Pseudomonadota bacterium]
MSLPESATRYDIARTLGDTRALTLTRRQRRGGPVVDQAGMSATLTLSDRASGAALATLSTANAGIAPLDASGVIAIDLGHAAYVALPAGAYSYRLDTVEAGETRPLLRGTWRVVA